MRNDTRNWKNPRRVMGRWGGLSAKFIAEEMLGTPYTTVVFQLNNLKSRLGRYPNGREIATFVWERIEKEHEEAVGPGNFVHY